MRTAESQAGTPYVWGGESTAEGGYDCSGLMQWAYAQHGVDLPRVSRDQAKVGRAVSAAEARPGDLVYFERQAPRPDHVGMYAGGGEWIVAPKTGDVVKRQKVDLSEATTIRRVLPEPGVGLLGPARRRVRRSTASTGAWSSGLPAAGRRFAPLIEQAAQQAGVDPRLLASLAWSESGFDPSATSPAGATGLVQLMPATARGLGVDDATDPAQSLRGGATYLKQQLDGLRRRRRAGAGRLQRRADRGAPARRGAAVRGDPAVRADRARPLPLPGRDPVTTPALAVAPAPTTLRNGSAGSPAEAGLFAGLLADAAAPAPAALAAVPGGPAARGVAARSTGGGARRRGARCRGARHPRCPLPLRACRCRRPRRSSRALRRRLPPRSPATRSLTPSCSRASRCSTRPSSTTSRPSSCPTAPRPACRCSPRCCRRSLP